MKTYISAIALLAMFAISISSCKEPVIDVEPIIGCTDPEAENYDANADQEDNTLCVYARDKFLNEYNGVNECPAPLPQESDFVLEITEGLTSENAVLIEFKNLDLPVPILEGTASGDTIMVPSDVYQVPLGLDPTEPDKLYDVTMSATAIYISADSIKGSLNLVALSIPATCNFRAGKN